MISNLKCGRDLIDQIDRKIVKLSLREFKKENTIVKINKNVEIAQKIHVIAGPCAVENKK
ncbi:MAG: hypothetical protein LBG23_04920 [Endomicrobium sp.]|nr:hypothetical protein [Endomicrobium sp.]